MKLMCKGTAFSMPFSPNVDEGLYNENYIYLNTAEAIIALPFSEIQSTLFISTSKGPAETLRDIRTSIYQMCRIEENIKRTTEFHK